MDESAAIKLSAKAKPCPFCGERLVPKNDHHGWWVGHKNDLGPCFESIAQLHDNDGLKRWNFRNPGTVEQMIKDLDL